MQEIALTQEIENKEGQAKEGETASIVENLATSLDSVPIPRRKAAEEVREITEGKKLQNKDLPNESPGREAFQAQLLSPSGETREKDQAQGHPMPRSASRREEITAAVPVRV